jgi:hypothetical protein
MTKAPKLKKLIKIVVLLALLWLGFVIYVRTNPLIVLHYSADAAEPVVYFLNRDDHILKEEIKPGQIREFRAPRDQKPDYYIEVSLPFASRDGVELKPPFSRVDVYIGADTRIARTVVHNDYWARWGGD